MASGGWMRLGPRWNRHRRMDKIPTPRMTAAKMRKQVFPLFPPDVNDRSDDAGQ